MNIIYQNLKRVYKEGVIVWGHVIQANSMLFDFGTDDHPGELVYSIDTDNQPEVEELGYVARSLFDLKGTKPESSDLLEIADYLTDERIRVFGLDVPKSISPNYNLKISTTMFIRDFLPKRRLDSSLIPILVLPEPPYVAITLPEKYWPEDFARQWVRQ